MKRILLLMALILLAMPALGQIVDIPDPNFKDALVNDLVWDTDGDGDPDAVVDSSGDGEIQITEAEAIDNLIIVEGSIESIEGIAAFTNLSFIKIWRNPLTYVDLTGLENLVEIDFDFNDIETIVFNVPNIIEELYLESNNLTSWSHPELTSLRRLDLNGTGIVSYSFEGADLLEYLNLGENDFEELNLNGLPNLETLVSSLGEINSVNLFDLPSLRYLYLTRNQLSEIDLSTIPGLESLWLSRNFFTEINLTPLNNLKTLNLSNNLITEINLEPHDNLERLDLSDNLITEIDLEGLNFLENLNLSSTSLSVINLEGLDNLNVLSLGNTNISEIDFSSVPNVEIISLDGLELGASLDMSSLSRLRWFSITDTEIQYLNVKTGSAIELVLFNNCFNLEYICADDSNLDILIEELEDVGLFGVEVNSYCSFDPGGEVFSILGEARLDTLLDGCDATDISVPFMRYELTDGVDSGNYFADSSGNYRISVNRGFYQVTPFLEFPEYFTIDPGIATFSFPADGSTEIQDFCLTPAGSINDLEITLVPLTGAIPGFESKYILSFKNNGTTTLSGEVVLNFEEPVLDFMSSDTATSAITDGELVWDFTDLPPFGQTEIEVVFVLNTPTDDPPLDSGDILDFTASLVYTGTDETPENNSFDLNQEVTNSFDPNDKTALEGDKILEESVGDNMHYLIRFENLGTANATNVVVADTIDTSKYQLSTLIPLSGSHDFVTRVNNNVAEFIFEGINLPFDDANNDGYVLFKIKTQESLVLGDSFSNSAAIYFDFNAPIITNEATTTVVNTLGIDEFEADNSSLRLYPNPTAEVLNIASLQNSELRSLQVYNLQGQLLIDNQPENNTIDVSGLSSGVYFLKINTVKGAVFKRFLKNL